MADLLRSKADRAYSDDRDSFLDEAARLDHKFADAPERVDEKRRIASDLSREAEDLRREASSLRCNADAADEDTPA